MVFLLPGTYKIIDEDNGTCITDRNEEAVHWHVNDHRDQEWYLQRSGECYFLKNCQSGRYLAVDEVKWITGSLKAVCRRLPAVWVFTRDTYGIHIKTKHHTPVLTLVGENPGSVNLDGRHLRVRANLEGCPVRRLEWIFERLSTSTGEEGEEDLSEEREAPTKNKQVAEEDGAPTTVDPILLEKDRQIVEQNTRLAERDRELGEATGRLANLHQELAQIRHELAEKSSRLAETEVALRRAEEQLASRDAKLLRIREQLDGDSVQDNLSLSQQKGADETRTAMQGFKQNAQGKRRGNTRPSDTPWGIFGQKH